jgi:nucleotide-binding universal stress UspA family protein
MLEDHAHGPVASHPVVVGIDGSTGGWDALAWAAAEARVTGRSLRIVHVVEWPALADLWPVPLLDRVVSLRSAGADLLEDGARRAREVVPQLAVATQLAVEADVSEALVRVAADASMLVLGKRRGARPWWRRGRRRVAVAVARRSRCPVAVVELSGEPGGALTGWVVVLDDAPRLDSPAIRFARSEADRRGVDVAVVPTADWQLFRHRGAALVVMEARCSGRLGVRRPVDAARALATASEPIVFVSG